MAPGRNGSHDRERLTTPLVRIDDTLTATDWPTALARVADGLHAVMADHGPRAVGMFSCSKATNEMNYAAQKFMRTAIGSNNIDSCNRT